MSEQNVTVELFYNSIWNDHSDAADMDQSDIRLTQGATDVYSHAQPASCQLVFDNRDGTFHPKNPNSSLYGLIGRNTPIRVSVEGDVRFSGEVASWTPRRGVKKDAWTNVVANGISRRLGQGSTPLRSSLATEIPKQFDTGDLHAYWPCEDGPNATQIASGLTGVEPLRITGDVELAVDAPILATGALPRLNDGSLNAPVPAGLADKAVSLLEVPDVGLTDGGLVCRMSMLGGDIDYSELRYITAGGGNLQITLVDNDGNTDTDDSTFTGLALDGGFWVITFVTLQMAGNTLSLGGVKSIAPDGSLGSLVTFGGASLTGTDPGFISHVTYGGGLGGGIFGHPAITSSADSDFPYDAEGTTTAYLGEPAGDRVERLCDQEDVPVTISGTASDTQAMGAQDINTLLGLLQECEFADGGILHDAVTQLGFTYRTGRSLYNQAAALTLDWDTGEIAEPLEPVTDDHDVRNDVTVGRPNGSSARAVRESGPLSVQDPPDGVGRYDTSDEANVPGDGFLEGQAGWRLHLGTVDETRFPRVSIDLDAGTTLASDVNAVRPGDRLDLENLPPEHVAVGEASLLVLGWTERVGIHKRKITFNCTPEPPYRIGELDAAAVLATIGSDSATLAEDLDTTETGVDIDCGAGPDWDHDGTNYDIEVGGERMTVTAAGAVSGTFPARTQTLTVTRSVNGVVKTHSSGDPVAIADPIYVGL